MIRTTANSRQKQVDSCESTHILRPDDSEMWTLAHIKQLREMIVSKCSPASDVQVDMSRVRHVSGGLFGMLCDLHDDGYKIRLREPQASIRNLIWFQRFFEHDSGDVYRFRSCPRYMFED